MKQVFKEHLGGLSLPEEDTSLDELPPQLPPLDQRGFAAVMLREAAEMFGLPVTDDTADFGRTLSARSQRRISSGVPHRRPSGAGSGGGSRRQSSGMKHSLGPGARHNTPASSTRSSSKGRNSARNSNRGSLCSLNSITLARWEAEKRRISTMSTSSRNSIVSVTMHLQRANSRGSRRESKGLEEVGMPSGAGHGILQLKGLPSQEEILARRLFRAPSIELSSGLDSTPTSDMRNSATSDRTTSDLLSHSPMFAPSSSDLCSLIPLLETFEDKKTRKSPNPIVLPGALPSEAMEADRKAQAYIGNRRLEKKATNTDDLVSDALMRLEALNGNDAESDSCPASPDAQGSSTCFSES
jgi:hypothetical protein